MDRGGARRYQTLARTLVGALASGPESRQRALDAGRAWGTRLAAGLTSQATDVGAAVAALIGVLAEFDFAPRHVPGSAVVDPPGESGAVDAAGPGAPGHLRLHHCPFLELAEEFDAVVCPLHLGMMQGVLAELGAPLRAEAIQPFAEPDACVVRLAVAPS